jgi:hypothetical protein
VEITMERRRRRRQTQTPVRQLDLLEPNPPSTCGASPEWNSLPRPTRCALTDLVVCLLVEHAGGETRVPRSRADDH